MDHPWRYFDRKRIPVMEEPFRDTKHNFRPQPYNGSDVMPVYVIYYLTPAKKEFRDVKSHECTRRR